MKISNCKIEIVGETKKASAQVVWEECNLPSSEIYFESDKRFFGVLDCNVHAFLVACIIPAFVRGEKRIYLDEEICPELRDGLLTALQWICYWYYPAGRDLPRIEAKVRASGSFKNRNERVGSLLSGGIDSLAVLRWNHLRIPASHPGYIRDAVVILGLQGENETTCSDILRTLEDVTKDAGVDLISVKTNIVEVLGASVPWEAQWEGSVLAAVAHVLEGWLTQVLIAATLDVPHMAPLGSHPLVDPNYGSSGLRIRHEGITLSRLEKTRLVAEWDMALQRVRVCNKVPKKGKTASGTLNCGRCEKCLRTMLALLTLGALHKCRAFPETDITPELINELVNFDAVRGHLVVHNYEELIQPLCAIRRNDLALTIRRKISEFRRLRQVSVWKSRARMLDQKYLAGGLRKLRNVVCSE